MRPPNASLPPSSHRWNSWRPTFPSGSSPTMSPGYQEVRLALLGQVMDESRHLDVFRQRALANGCGLMRMIDSVTDVAGGSTDNAREYTELSTRMHIVGEGNVLTLFRLG